MKNESITATSTGSVQAVYLILQPVCPNPNQPSVLLVIELSSAGAFALIVPLVGLEEDF